MKPAKRFNWSTASATVNNLYRKGRRQYRRYVDTYLKDRSLREVERFVFSWLTVFVLATAIIWQQTGHLSSHYLDDGPAPGGQFTEGMVGEIEVINPLFAGDRVSRSAQALIFSSLFKYDGDGKIVPDLATEFELSEDETVYTVKLRTDAYWHDGRPVTAEDVVFTFATIQNPDTGSSLQLNWQGIRVAAQDSYTVEFELPNPYAPFLTQLTTGIVPKHLLDDVTPDRMRVTSFNQTPIGSGPFILREITGNSQVRLRANDRYYGGQPQLEYFSISVYPDIDSLIGAFNRGELSSMLAPSELDVSSIEDRKSSIIQRINVTSQVFAFFNNRRFDDVRLRRALVHGLNTAEVVSRLNGGHDRALSPLLPEHIGYKPSQLGFDPDAAQKLLGQSGWQMEDGLLRKDNRDFEIEIVTQNSTEYSQTAAAVAEQWRKLGMTVSVQEVDNLDLQQDYIRPRNFDVLLFGIALGSDPDVYAYWHSSQAEDVGRNLSQYNSDVADLGLEDGRTRTDPRLRAAKYEAFQGQWRTDAPAIALYRLHNYYVSRSQAQGIRVENVAHTTDRFYNVVDWTINTQPVLQRLQ